VVADDSEKKKKLVWVEGTIAAPCRRSDHVTNHWPGRDEKRKAKKNLKGTGRHGFIKRDSTGIRGGK